MKEHLGIDGTVLLWFSSYLKERYQKVCLQDSFSAPSQLLYVVPQGSILGSILFSVYLLPLVNIIQKYDMGLHIYVDDMQLYCFF